MKFPATPAIAALMTVAIFGCGAASQPWAGQPYQPPGNRNNPARHVFTPRPQILPGRRAERFDSQQQDEEIERLLFGHPGLGESAESTGTNTRPDGQSWEPAEGSSSD